MELTFEKIDGQWVAEFEATSDFNINLDRAGKGALVIYQKGSKDGTYASQASYRNTKDSENVDADITALVYPKYIKVVSQTEVVKGIVTMNGEGGGSNVVDNPDDYEQDLTLIISDGDGDIESYDLKNLQEHDIVRYENKIPTTLVIQCVYIKNGERIPFIPKYFKLITRLNAEDACLSNTFTIQNNEIFINLPDIVWMVANHQLIFESNKMNFRTYINTAA